MAVAEKVSVELELLDKKYRDRLDANAIVFDRQMKRMEKDAERAADQIEASLGRVPESLKQKYRELGADIGRSFQGISRGAQLAFGAITAYSLKLASDAQEIESAFQVAFGGATESVKAFSEQLGDTAGRDAVVLRESMTRLQLVLTGTGVAAGQAAELVKTLATVGVDAGSLFNTSDAEALQKIISGLSGEAEPLKAFGVVLTEAAVKAELLRLGFKGNAEQASEAAKSIARANLIIKGLAVAQGDAARTSDSAANTTKRMTAEFNKAARDLGTQLLPAMTKLFGAATDVLKAFNDLPGGVQVAGLAFLGLIAAGGPIAGLIANLARLRLIAIETRVALAAVGGGSAANGLGVGVAAAAGIGGGLLLSQGSFAKPDAGGGNTGTLAEQLAFRQRNRSQINPNANATQRRIAARLDAEIAELQGKIRTREGLNAIATGEAAPDAGVLGGFSLGDLANGPPGKEKKARAASGPTAEEIASRQETLRLQNELNLAEAQGRTAAAAAAQRQLDINALEADFKAAQIKDARTLATAQVDAIIAAETTQKQIDDFVAASERRTEARIEGERALASETERRLRFRLQLAVIAGDETEIRRLERELSLLQRINDLGGNAAQARTEENALNTAEDDAAFRERGAQAARSFIGVIRSDDIGAELGNRFREAAFDGLETILTNLFSQAFSGKGGGIGNIFSSVASVFGGGRASGGPVRAGFTYDVGERGREKFVAPANGFIIPNMGASAKSVSPTSITIRQSFDLAGVTGDQAIYANVGRMIQQGQRQTLAIVKSSAPAAQLEQDLLRA